MRYKAPSQAVIEIMSNRMGMQATAVPAVPVTAAYQMLNSVRVVETRVGANNYDGFERTPVAVEFEGVRYGRSSWNSDTGVVIYRNDTPFATA